jgi:hypothetical protein
MIPIPLEKYFRCNGYAVNALCLRAAEAEATARAAKKLPNPAPEAFDPAASLREKGKRLQATKRELNRSDIRTPLGSQWHPRTVRNQLFSQVAVV